MIATLTGRVAGASGGCCLLEVNGVGYEVQVSLPALEELARSEGEVRLHTYLHLREDAVQLFGFQTLEEKRVFERLIGVTGVGPKTALSVLSVLSLERLREAVEGDDYRLLASVPGIGQKTAQRLALELRGKLAPARGQAKPGSTGKGGGEVADAVEALMALGYLMPAAMQAVEAAAAQDGIQTAPALVRGALKRLAR